MQRLVYALPTLLRPAVLLAAASQNGFSVNEDLLAFPQFDIHFSEQWIPKSKADSLTGKGAEPFHENTSPVDVAQYGLSDGRSALGDGAGDGNQILEYETMSMDGQEYLCSIPHVEKMEEEPGVNETLSKAEKEQELLRATDRGWQLLDGMHGSCIYFLDGWWSYKFCYKGSVRQFHQLPPGQGIPAYPPVEDPTVEGYTLGKYRSTATRVDTTRVQEGVVEETGLTVSQRQMLGHDGLVERGDTRYLVQRLERGTVCDLTGKERKIEIQYHCNPNTVDRVSVIQETSTCNYLMIVQTPRLCHDVAFLPTQKDDAHTIVCSPVLASDQVAKFEHSLAQLKRSEEESRIWAENPEADKIFHPDAKNDAQFVGDLELGAHHIVPRGVKIEKSAIVGGGKETYIDTVASSDGWVLTKEKLAKLGVKRPEEVERLRRQAESLAKGMRWQLDIVDTARGAEYRLVIGADRLEEKPNKDGAGDGAQGSEEEFYREEL